MEVDHVGQALAAHRERLRVSLEEMGRFEPREARADLAKIEKSRTVLVDHAERHHANLLKAWADQDERASLPVAVREQWYTDLADQLLTNRARTARPAVIWWWGVRTEPEARGAWCYVCEAQIHRYDVGRGMTKRARLMVMTHRYGHAIALQTLAIPEPKESYL